MRSSLSLLAAFRRTSPPISFALIPPPFDATENPVPPMEDLPPTPPPKNRHGQAAQELSDGYSFISTPTPAFFNNIPDIFVDTPDETDNPSYRFCAYSASDPPSPQTPDLSKLHEALAYLERMTERTPIFRRPSRQTTGDAIPMPKRKVFIEAPAAQPPKVTQAPFSLSRNTKRSPASVSRAFKDVFKSKRAPQPLPPLPKRTISEPARATYRRSPEPSFNPFNALESMEDPENTPSPYVNHDFGAKRHHAPKPSSPPETPATTSRRFGFSRFLPSNRRQTVFISPSGRQSTPFLPIGASTSQVPDESPLKDYKEKGSSFSTQSLPLRLRGNRPKRKPNLTINPYATRASPPPVPPLPLAAALHLSRTSSSELSSGGPITPPAVEPLINPLQPSVVLADSQAAFEYKVSGFREDFESPVLYHGEDDQRSPSQFSFRKFHQPFRKSPTGPANTHSPRVSWSILPRVLFPSPSRSHEIDELLHNRSGSPFPESRFTLLNSLHFSELSFDIADF